MSHLDKVLLDENGWQVECESPLEIRHEDGSTATGTGAEIVLAYYQRQSDAEDNRFN